jgi:hypothetical protein
VLCCGLYHPLTYAQQVAAGFAFDVVHYPGYGFVEYALGPEQSYPEQHEFDIRSPWRNAGAMPSNTPITLIHGTKDDNVDIRHAVELYARLLALGKRVRFAAIAGGDHGLAGAEAPDEGSRYQATLKYAAPELRARRESEGDSWPLETAIDVSGGQYRVCYGPEGATLSFVAMAGDSDGGSIP